MITRYRRLEGPVDMNDPIGVALREALHVLSHAPAALVTDIDGTISPIVARPEDARVGERSREALRSLVGRLDVVAVVTARDEATARRMLGVEGLTYVGNYGLDADAASRADPAAVEAVKARAWSLIAPFPCVQLEEKGVSFALHYRNCDDGGMRERLLRLVAPVAERAGARLIEGKQVVEVVPAGLPDKGTAIGRLIDARGVRGIVYLGDDLSDVAVFRELQRRHRLNGLSALSIAAVDNETDASVLEAASLELAGVEVVEEFLRHLSRSLGREEV